MSIASPYTAKKYSPKDTLNCTEPLVSFHLWAIFLSLTGDWTKPSRRMLALPKAAKCCRGTRAAIKQLWTYTSFSSPAARMFYNLLPSKEIDTGCKENYFTLRLAKYLFHKLEYIQSPEVTSFCPLELQIQCSAFRRTSWFVSQIRLQKEFAAAF